MIYAYFELATDVDNEELNALKQSLSNKDVNPRDLKRSLARKLVAMYHSEDAAQEAEREFDNIFVKKGLPDEIPEFIFNDDIKELEIIDLIVTTNLAPSKSEARRLIVQGGVSMDGEKITDLKTIVKLGKSQILKVGKRNFLKLIGN